MRNGLTERILKFQAVGAAGIVVQMTSLALFHGWLRWSISAATAAAVEAAILHNFFWHLWWTWGDRNKQQTAAGVLQVLWRYNLTYSLTSIATNLACMHLLMRAFHLHYLVANLLAIAAGSVANFLAGEFLLFRPTSPQG